MKKPMKRISKTLSITLPPEYKRRIDEQGEREQRSASEIIREALRSYYGIGRAAQEKSDRRQKIVAQSR